MGQEIVLALGAAAPLPAAAAFQHPLLDRHSLLSHAGNPQVPELLPQEVLEKMHAPPKSDDPVITAAQLKEYDGFIFGIPTRFGMMASQASRARARLGAHRRRAGSKALAGRAARRAAMGAPAAGPGCRSSCRSSCRSIGSAHARHAAASRAAPSR